MTYVYQVDRLADILEIPPERLTAIGKNLIFREQEPAPTSLKEADDFLLQTLLEPAQATVKLSWLVWYANHDTAVVEHLKQLVNKLEDAVTNRRENTRRPRNESVPSTNVRRIYRYQPLHAPLVHCPTLALWLDLHARNPAHHGIPLQGKAMNPRVSLRGDDAVQEIR